MKYLLILNSYMVKNQGISMRNITSLVAVFLILLRWQATSVAEELSGIGAKIAEKDGQIVLETVYPGTPADQAGIRSGEAVLTIDGKSVHSKSVQEVQKLLQGRAGTKIKLLIQDGEGNTRGVDIIRKSLRISASGPSDFIGEFTLKDDPQTKIVVKMANVKKYQIFCEKENWSGAGLIYQNPTYKTFHYKGVFRMDDSPQVESPMRGVGGFFRINYLTNGALELKRQWGLDGDPGSKSNTVILLRSDAKKE
jgi:membrane-associated protease RseP (regulator of RpoE activity)